jgi:hypothetical protein
MNSSFAVEEQLCGYSSQLDHYEEIGFGETPTAMNGEVPFTDGAYPGIEAVCRHGYPPEGKEKYAATVTDNARARAPGTGANTLSTTIDRALSVRRSGYILGLRSDLTARG